MIYSRSLNLTNNSKLLVFPLSAIGFLQILKPFQSGTSSSLLSVQGKISVSHQIPTKQTMWFRCCCCFCSGHLQVLGKQLLNPALEMLIPYTIRKRNETIYTKTSTATKWIDLHLQRRAGGDPGCRGGKSINYNYNV